MSPELQKKEIYSSVSHFEVTSPGVLNLDAPWRSLKIVISKWTTKLPKVLVLLDLIQLFYWKKTFLSVSKWWEHRPSVKGVSEVCGNVSLAISSAAQTSDHTARTIYTRIAVVIRRLCYSCIFSVWFSDWKISLQPCCPTWNDYVFHPWAKNGWNQYNMLFCSVCFWHVFNIFPFVSIVDVCEYLSLIRSACFERARQEDQTPVWIRPQVEQVDWKQLLDSVTGTT